MALVLIILDKSTVPLHGYSSSIVSSTSIKYNNVSFSPNSKIGYLKVYNVQLLSNSVIVFFHLKILICALALTPIVTFNLTPISIYPPATTALPPPVEIDVVNIPPTSKYGPASTDAYTLITPIKVTFNLTLIASDTSIFPST